MERSLIESVRKHQCLWKTDIEEYKLNDVKEAAWREIVKECDLPDVKEAKTLWRKLRDGHRQAVNRKKTGQAANTKKIWKYEKVMEFLLPTMQSRSRTTNINMEQENESSENEEHQTDNDIIMVPPKKENESSDNEEHQTDNDMVPPKKKRNLISLYIKEQKRRKIRSGERDSMRRQLSCNSNNVENTALGNFFMSMLQTTSDLPENLQLKVQRQLFNIVMEAKEEDIATRRHSIASSGSSSTV